MSDKPIDNKKKNNKKINNMTKEEIQSAINKAKNNNQILSKYYEHLCAQAKTKDIAV